MARLRRLFRDYPVIAAVAIAGALFARLLVPGGWMIAVDHGRIAVVACPGVVATPAMHGMHHSLPVDHQKAEQPCAFAGLYAPALDAVDPVLLAVALAFVALLALRPRRMVPRRSVHHLRPPLRGPPEAFLRL